MKFWFKNAINGTTTPSPETIPNPKPETNLVWVKGYKGTDKDMRCNGYQFALGETFKHEGSVKMCCRGFHFCLELPQTLDYYHFNFSHRYFEVEALIDPCEQVDSWGDTPYDKRVAHEIRFVREVPAAEVFALVKNDYPFVKTDKDLSVVMSIASIRDNDHHLAYEDFALAKYIDLLRDKYSDTFLRLIWERCGNYKEQYELMRRAEALYDEGVSPDMRAYLLLR